MTLEAIPLVGIGPVRFGMTRDEVHAECGPCHSFEKMPGVIVDALFDRGLQVFYDSEDRVELVEVNHRLADRVTLRGELVLQLPMRRALDHVSAMGPLDEGASQPGYAFVFPVIEASLWRATTDQQSFQTLGLGRRGLYSAAPRRRSVKKLK